MCKNSEIISHLAKIKKTGKSFRHLSAKRGQHELKLFLFVYTPNLHIRDLEGTRWQWERPLSRSRLTLFNIVSTLRDWQCLYLFFVRILFSPQHFLSHLWARSLLHKLPLVVCQGFGVCQPICHFQHGALLQSSVDSRWTKEWMLNIRTAPSCAPQRTNYKKKHLTPTLKNRVLSTGQLTFT